MYDWVSNFFQWWTAERLSAASAFCGMVVAAVAAMAALKQLRLSREALQQSNRPMMMAEYLPPESSGRDLTLKVTNAGNSVARNVTVKFKPELPSPTLDDLRKHADDGSYYLRIPIELTKKLFNGKTFHTWVPGQIVTAPLWAKKKGSKASETGATSAEGVPNDLRIVFNYEDDSGRQYEDEFVLDPGIWEATLFAESESEKQRKSIRQIARAQTQFFENFMKLANLYVARKAPLTEQEIQEEKEYREEMRALAAKLGFSSDTSSSLNDNGGLKDNDET